MKVLVALLLSFPLYASFYTKDFQYQIPANIQTSSEINETNFYEITYEIYDYFTPHERDISVNLDWEKPFFTAWANKEISGYSINFWGGFARLPAMTKSTWAFTVCHELGHIIGGVPYHEQEYLAWSSAEGQADHFATQICLPRYLKRQYSLGLLDYKFGHYKLCQETYSDVESQIICQHIQDVAIRFNEIVLYMKLADKPASFETPAKAVSTSEVTGYPSAQCRFDIAIISSLHLQLEKRKRNNCWYYEK